VNRRAGVFGGVALVLGSVLILSLAWGLQHAALANPSVLGKAAPRLAIETQGGEQVSVWQLQGKPVVLNFWASWCTTCVQELEVLSKAFGAHPGVAFVGADSQDTSGGFTSFERQHPHPVPVGHRDGAVRSPKVDAEAQPAHAAQDEAMRRARPGAVLIPRRSAARAGSGAGLRTAARG